MVNPREIKKLPIERAVVVVRSVGAGRGGAGLIQQAG